MNNTSGMAGIATGTTGGATGSTGGTAGRVGMDGKACLTSTAMKSNGWRDARNLVYYASRWSPQGHTSGSASWSTRLKFPNE